MTKIQQTGQARQESAEGVRIRTVLPIRIKRRGGRKHVIAAAHSPTAEAQHDAPILTALSRAFHWQRLIDEGVVESGTDIARREGLHHTTVNELLRLTLLSPRMVRAILDGRQPKTLSLLWLKNHAVPQDWAAQEALFDACWSDPHPPHLPQRADQLRAHDELELTCVGLGVPVDRV